MLSVTQSIDRHKSPSMAGVVRDGLHGRVTDAMTFLRWTAVRLVRWAAISAVLLGLLGSRASIPQLVSGEVIETIEVVVSVNWRQHESETFAASDRAFSRRKCVCNCGRSSNIVRGCCRHMGRDFRHCYMSVGHRRPDNSVAPLLI